jgi:AcrR family transcriptional regulator
MSEATSRPTIRGRRTEAALERAARAVIARKGFFNTTIADITRVAKRSPASFYNYFDSKEDLLGKLAEDFKEAAKEREIGAYRYGVPPRRLIEESTRAHWQTYKEQLAVMIGVFQLAMTNEEFAHRWRALCAEAIEAVAGTVERAQRDGYCPGANPRLVGSAVVAMLNQFSYVWLAEGGEAVDVDFDEEQAIQTLAEVWYRAIYWKPDNSSITNRRRTS